MASRVDSPTTEMHRITFKIELQIENGSQTFSLCATIRIFTRRNDTCDLHREMLAVNAYHYVVTSRYI